MATFSRKGVGRLPGEINVKVKRFWFRRHDDPSVYQFSAVTVRRFESKVLLNREWRRRKCECHRNLTIKRLKCKPSADQVFKQYVEDVLLQADREKSEGINLQVTDTKNNDDFEFLASGQSNDGRD